MRMVLSPSREHRPTRKFLTLENRVWDGVLVTGCRIETMSRALPELQKDFGHSLEQLYETFSGYAFRPDMPCCIPHCHEQAEIDLLGSKPLRELTAKELSEFAANLLLTCGETPDFKYFLPRVFEIAVVEGFVWPDLEIVIGKLKHADWNLWPEHERNAVQAFLNAWWRFRLLSSKLVGVPLNDCLAALCCAHEDPTQYLEMWLQTSEISAVEHLTAFVLEHWTSIWLGKSLSAFVEKPSMVFIKRWLQSERTLEYLERGFFEHADSPIAADISFALSVLEPSV